MSNDSVRHIEDNTVPKNSAEPESIKTCDPCEPEKQSHADEPLPHQSASESEAAPAKTNIDTTNLRIFVLILLLVAAIACGTAFAYFTVERHTAALEGARNCLDLLQYESALDHLEQYPILSRLSPVLREIRVEASNQFLKICISSSDNYAEVGKYHEAIGIVRNGISRFPHESDLTTRHTDFWESYADQTIDAADTYLDAQDIDNAFECVCHVLDEDPPAIQRDALQEKKDELTLSYAESQISSMYSFLDAYDYAGAQAVIANALSYLEQHETLSSALKWLEDNEPYHWIDHYHLSDSDEGRWWEHINNGQFRLITGVIQPKNIDEDNTVNVALFTDDTLIYQSEPLTPDQTDPSAFALDITGITTVRLEIRNTDSDVWASTINNDVVIVDMYLWELPPAQWINGP